MLTETPGVGQRYIAAYKDAGGEWLTGGSTYRLHVPPNSPAKQFSSVTAYAEGTGQMVVTKQGRPDIRPAKKTLWPTRTGQWTCTSAPRRLKARRRTGSPDRPRRRLVAYFRFYGPTEPFFDKSWALPDFEKMS